MYQYFNQILTAVLEVLDDSEASVRELVLSLIIEMLNNQVITIILVFA
jgi:CLIP-associating protein 1/2